MDLKNYFNTSKITGRYQQVIAEGTAKALQLFCDQEPEFKQAIEESEDTFQDCLDDVVKGVKYSLSDLEAYKKAVQFYFFSADISFHMTIDLSENNGYTPPPITVTQSQETAPKSTTEKKKIDVSLDDLLDF